MIRRIAFIMAALIVVSTMSVQSPGAKDSTIKVGVVLPLTGPHADFGTMMKNSMLMARREIKKADSINGKTIDLLFEDDASRGEIASSATEKLIVQDHVVIVTGGYLSTTTVEAAKVCERHRVPFLVQTASQDEITESGRDYLFRLCTPASEYPATVLSFLKEVVKPKTVAIVYVKNNFGKSTASAFLEGAKEAGIRILMEQSYHPQTTDFKTLVTKMKALNPELVFMVSFVTDGAIIVKQAKELGLTPKLFVGNGGGFTMPAFAEKAGDAAENVFSVAPWTPHISFLGAKAFANSYWKRYGTEADYHGAEAFAATLVIADALTRAKEITPEGVKQALTKTDMMTAFGPVKFQSYGKKKWQNKLPTYLVQWQKGTLETVWPKRVASKPYVYPVTP